MTKLHCSGASSSCAVRWGGFHAKLLAKDQIAKEKIPLAPEPVQNKGFVRQRMRAPIETGTSCILVDTHVRHRGEISHVLCIAFLTLNRTKFSVPFIVFSEKFLTKPDICSYKSSLFTKIQLALLP